ncbi:MAG: glycosyltransferase family 9 protein [Phycisphaerae bacterium]|nr:glycosyltransferase family 9 protein [Phycisphaerae bacterium]MDW8261478.1 glycosyltransferase family 9 protein [Phycisphaerales bacterium]
MPESTIPGLMQRNILIFHHAALGDFIVTWPMAMACGRLFPQNRVIYVTAAGKGRLAERILGVESVDIESGFSHLWSDTRELPTTARRILEQSAMILSFVADAEGNWANNVRSLAPRASLVCLSTKPPEEFDGHVAQYIAQQLADPLPGLAAGTLQMIDALSRRGFGPRSEERRGVLIHPGSGAQRKNWPRERFLGLAERLRSAGQHVTVVLGEVELEKWGSAAREEFAAIAQVVVPQTLTELADRIIRSATVVCNDSGPAHLAAVTATPTVVLFGPTSHPVRWRPLGPAVRMLLGQPLEAITVEDVLAAISPP